MKLEVVKDKKSPFISKVFLKSFLRFLEQSLVERKILSSSDKKLVIAFVSSSDMQKMNKKFLQKDYVTDVLSFSPSEPDSFGELALCGEQIKAQSEKHGFSFEEETAYLVLHGFLHLLGYQHEQGGEEAKKMYKTQDEIFQSWQDTFKKQNYTDPV